MTTFTGRPLDRGRGLKTPAPPKKIKILQWNAQGVKHKIGLLTAALKADNIDVAVIQESLITEGTSISIPGYNSYHLHYEPGNRIRGLLTLVKKKMISRTCQNIIQCGEGTESLGISITTRNQVIDIYNIYSSPNHGQLDMGELFHHASTHPSLIAGDFNAHHPSFNPPPIAHKMDTQGIHLFTMLNDYPGIRMLNAKEPTHDKGGALDLIFTSELLSIQAEFKVHNYLSSDHYACLSEINAYMVPQPNFIARWNTKKADWGKFQDAVRQWRPSHTASSDLDEHNQQLVEALNAAASSAMPKTKPPKTQHKDAWYYDARVKELKHRLNAIKSTFLKNKTNKNLDLFRSSRKLIIKEIEDIKTAKWLQWCESINAHTSISSLWSQLNEARGDRHTPLPNHPDPAAEAENLMQAFKTRRDTKNLPRKTINTLKRMKPRRIACVEYNCGLRDTTDQPFTMHELQAILKSGKDTAPGEDRITNSMILHAGPEGHQAILDLLNHSLASGFLPKAWKESVIVPVPKPDGGQRPIELLSCLNKTMEKLIRNRIVYEIGPLSSDIYAYQRNIGAQEAIAKINYLMNKPNAVAINLDLEKAFELCNKEVILESLAKKGIKGRLLKWVKDFLSNRKARTTYQGHISSLQQFEQGTPQGSALSPLLFNLAMERLLEVPRGAKVHMVAYADDLTIVVVGDDSMDEVKRVLKAIDEQCSLLGFKINYEKSNAMKIRAKIPAMQLTVQNRVIDWVSAHKILGIQHHTSLNPNTHIKYITDRIQSKLNVMRAMTSPKLGLNYQVLRTFYIACIRSIIDYASIHLITSKDETLSRLEKIQNQALRIMFGTPPWAKLVNLRQEANLVPINIRIWEVSARFMFRNLRRGRLEDLNAEVLQCLQQLQEGDGQAPAVTSPFASRMAQCLHQMGITLAVARSQDLPHPQYAAPPPWEEPLHSTNFITTKLKQQLSISNLRSICAEIKSICMRSTHSYFTDGSVNSNTSTAACAFVSRDTTASFRITDGASTLQAELAGIMKALQHASDKTHCGHVNIFTDSMGAVMLPQHQEQADNISLTTNILYHIRTIHSRGGTITLTWVPAILAFEETRPQTKLPMRASLYLASPSLWHQASRCRRQRCTKPPSPSLPASTVRRSCKTHHLPSGTASPQVCSRRRCRPQCPDSSPPTSTGSG